MGGVSSGESWLKPNGEKARERASAAIIGWELPAVNGGPITAARKAP